MANQLTYYSPSTNKTYILDDVSGALVGVAKDLRGSEWRWDMSESGALSGGGRMARKTELDAWAKKDYADALFEAFEADALSGTPGTLTAQNEWTCKALYNGHSLSFYDANRDSVNFTASILLPDGCWRKVTRVVLEANSARELTVDGLDLDDPQGIAEQGLDLGLDMPTIPPAPVVTVHPQSCNPTQTTRVTLWAHIRGYHLRYQWQKLAGSVWQDLDGETNSSITLDAGITGRYRLTAIDTYSRQVTTDVATITIAGIFDLGLDAPIVPDAPIITRQPESLAVTETTQAVVWLHAAGYRCSYLWQEYDELDDEWKASDKFGADTSAVEVPVGDVARLRCIVTDAFGQSVTSDEATVTLADEADFPIDAGFDMATDAHGIYVTPFERVESYGAVGVGDLLDIAGGDLDCDFYSSGSLTMDAGESEASWNGGSGSYGDIPGIDLGGTLFGVPFTVDNASGALVRIYFRGVCTYPYVLIAGNRYSVDAAAASGESIIVDPTQRRVIGGSVYRADRYGNTDNLFDYRGRGIEGSGSYIFERIPNGEHRASWLQSTNIDLDIIEERGTPPWS